MTFIKKVLNDSFVYGIGASMTRAINYLLVPIHTYAFSSASGEYSVITRMYAYTAILSVILTFGMETTYFYFMGKQQDKGIEKQLYSTILTFVGLISLLFSVLVILFIEPIGQIMQYQDYHAYILSLFVCIAFDAFQAIPAAYLRQHDEKKKYLTITFVKALFIVILNFIYFQLFPMLEIYPLGMYGSNGKLNIGYVFYINLFVSVISTFFYWKELIIANYKIEFSLLRPIIKYGFSLVIFQIAGTVIQNADKVLYPYLDKSIHSEQNLAIYGGVVKIATIIVVLNSIFIKAFEPLALNNVNEESNKEDLALAMKWYVVSMLMAFLGVNATLNFFRIFINRDYWSGLFVVPIVMGAQILLGIYQNLSTGYKQIDKNYLMVCFSFLAFFLFIFLNVVFVPSYGYEACAWAQLISFGFAVIISYTVSIRITKIKYPTIPILRYLGVTVLFFLCMKVINEQTDSLFAIIPNLLLMFLFIAYVVKDITQFSFADKLKKIIGRH